MHDLLPVSLLLSDSDQRRLVEEARRARIHAAVERVKEAVQQMESMEATLQRGEEGR